VIRNGRLFRMSVGIVAFVAFSCGSGGQQEGRRSPPTRSAVAPSSPLSPSPTLTAVAPPEAPTPARGAPAPPPRPAPPAKAPPQDPATAAAPPPPAPSPVTVETVATGLAVPWALAFAPDGRLFFTERGGQVRVIEESGLAPEPVAVLPVASVGESGLMGLALDPSFDQNGFLYVMYTHAGLGGLRNRVSRLRVTGNRAGGEQVILGDIPGAAIHDGGRLRFGPDGKLYVTTGDASDPEQAQSRESLAGKILRLNGDGSIPYDNPFPGSLVYSLGHRNPQGLDWRPGSGQLFATEHGPTGNDEVNRIEAGANYGWPSIQGREQASGMTSPLATFSPAVAPSGASFYNSDLISEWKGSFFFATLRGRHLHRMVFTGDGSGVALSERLFEGRFGRLRDVVAGPDGVLYVATNNRDGRGDPGVEDDRILRIVRR
jgi:glucose/arabinose dehydrogenase